MMYEKMKNMIKNGVNKGIDDTQAIRTGLYKWLGRDSQKCQSFVPFGTFGSPQDGTQGLLFQIRCRESSIVALDGDPLNRIKKDTKKGEYGIGNPLTRSNIYFKENGDAVLEIPKGDFSLVCTDGNATIDATEIILNSGSKGVARLDDATLVNSTTDTAFITWISTVSAIINGLAPGSIPVVPTTVLDKISSASTTVKAG